MQRFGSRKKCSNLLKENNFSKWMHCSFRGKEKKTASKESVIKIKDSTLYDRASNIAISRKMDANLAFCELKNNEKIEKTFRRSQFNVQRLALAFQVRENCFSKFIKINNFVTLMKTSFFGRNFYKWLSFRYKLSRFRWFREVDGRTFYQMFLMEEEASISDFRKKSTRHQSISVRNWYKNENSK